MRSRLVPMALAGMMLAGCDDGRYSGEVVEREGSPPVSMVASNDPEMATAIRKAQLSLDEFEQRLTHPPATQSYISIKGRFERDGVVEYIWLDHVRITADGYRGKIGNEPLDIKGLAIGQEVPLPRTDVADWMAIDGDHLIAGYSIRLLRSRLPQRDRERFDSEANFIVDD